MNIVSNKKAGIPKTRGTLPTYMYVYYMIYKTQFKQTFKYKCKFEKREKRIRKRTLVLFYA